MAEQDASDETGSRAGAFRRRNRRREEFVAKWESRWGPEAAGDIYVFRVLLAVSCACSMSLLTAAILLLFAHASGALYYGVGAAAVLVGPSIQFCSIRPLHRGLEVIRARYGVDRHTRMRLAVLARPAEFDRWVLMSRPDAKRTSSPPRGQR